MERDYAASSAMAYAQQQRQAAQQQQYGYPPQQPQFPQHGLPPSVAPHPPLQQFPYPQQYPPHPHAHPQHPHLAYHQQPPPPFPVPPHLPQPPFHGHYDVPAPPPAPPPSDPELLKRIEKTLEYAIKNGPEFEAMIREKQRDNPAYSFLFGGEGCNYYQYKLFISTRPPGGPFNAPYPSMMPTMHSAPNPMMGSPPMLNSAGAVPGPMMCGPPMHQHPFPPFYEQPHQHQQSFVPQAGTEYDQSSNPFKSSPGLPADILAELNNVVNNLNGTKESIKGAKTWFMQRSSFAPSMAEALKERIFQVNDSEKQLYIIYLVNDILFDSLQRRKNPNELDNEALAFRPVLGSMLAVVYHNPQNKEDNQSRLQKILQFWASKEVYDQNTVYGLEGEMISGPPPNFSKAPPASGMASSMISGMPQQPTNVSIPQWQMDKQSSVSTYSDQDQSGRQGSSALSAHQPLPNQQFLPTSMHGSSFIGSLPQQTSQQPAPLMLQTQAPTIGEKPPPYPLFPPGLIPGMVRKMQIGSGVPYSPLSPLDIPTIIPPSNVSPTEILERVSKFFKEIGEVNPSEGPLKQSGSKDEDDDYEYKRESPVRKGGACIPPPPNLQQADPDTGAYPDGTVEQKPGSTSSGRLGLGATANPNEVSQYDDVYSSYRKNRSTNYHSSMSARATTK